MKISEHLNRPQAAALRLVKPDTTSAFVFGRGVGKSYLQRLIWYRAIARAQAAGKSVRIILLCPSFKQAVDVYWRAFTAEIEGKYAALGGHLNHSRRMCDFPGGSWIQFFGAENSDKARGLRCDIVSVDEADDIDPQVFDYVVSPWLSEHWSQRTVVLTGTPMRGRFGLLYRYFQAGKEGNPKLHSLHATYKDAPEQISQEYVEQLKLTTSPGAFDREWLASFDTKEGLVYPFEAEHHVAKFDPDVQWNEVIVGVDFGYEDSGVFLAIGVAGSGRDAKLHVIEECVETHQVQSWWLERAKQWHRKYPDAKWFADPSQPAFIEALRREAGVAIRPAANNREEGVAAVADKMHMRPLPDGTRYSRFFIDPACRVTLREMSSYRRKRDRKDAERMTEAIQDGDDHAMDALRYAVFSRFGSPSSARIIVPDEKFSW